MLSDGLNIFSKLLNKSSQFDLHAIYDTQQHPIIACLDNPERERPRKPSNNLQPGKVPSPDGILPEVSKEGGHAIVTRVTELMQ